MPVETGMDVALTWTSEVMRKPLFSLDAGNGLQYK